MQTFLPFADFAETARHLDSRRLNNQVNECKAILRSLITESGWFRHPAVQMWKGHEHALGRYRDAILTEWIRRGGNNSRPMPYWEIDFDLGHRVAWETRSESLPPWLGDPRLHSSHRAVLQWKEIVGCEPEWYLKFNWPEQPEYNYFWPVRKGHAYIRR